MNSHRVSRQVITSPAQFQKPVPRLLRRLERLPSTIRRFFQAPDLRYVI